MFSVQIYVCRLRISEINDEHLNLINENLIGVQFI